MRFPRESGILLHPSSLPGPYGIGEIGPQALDFADSLKEMGQHLWQILPLGPTSYGDSPYQSPSTFAGNHLLISFEKLIADGLMSREWLTGYPNFKEGEVDYGRAIPARMEILNQVCDNFEQRADKELQDEYHTFIYRNGDDWLDDYAQFMALKDAHGGAPWTTWERPLVNREPKALRRACEKYYKEIHRVRIMQYLFYRQWRALRAHCHQRGVQLLGDIAIFVAHDSADVWAHPDLFYLDDEGNPEFIAGVPPDYFSATGQRWGNPLYHWDIMEGTGYEWWKKRLHHIFELVDVLRIDHFRGFESYWEIPADEPTAINGRWVPGPGNRFFDELFKAFDELPIIAEDLGVITPEVETLRDQYEFPGMRVLQFAFGNDPLAISYRPENHIRNCVCYTGTHDNDTTIGWFNSVSGEGSTRSKKAIEKEKRFILDYLGTDGSEIHWDMIKMALNSKANTAIFPLQDLLGLDSGARLNTPGKSTGNWCWRFTQDMLTKEIKQKLQAATSAARRM